MNEILDGFQVKSKDYKFSVGKSMLNLLLTHPDRRYPDPANCIDFNVTNYFP